MSDNPLSERKCPIYSSFFFVLTLIQPENPVKKKKKNQSIFRRSPEVRRSFSVRIKRVLREEKKRNERTKGNA
jgi:hypothetical protein